MADIKEIDMTDTEKKLADAINTLEALECALKPENLKKSIPKGSLPLLREYVVETLGRTGRN